MICDAHKYEDGEVPDKCPTRGCEKGQDGDLLVTAEGRLFARAVDQRWSWVELERKKETADVAQVAKASGNRSRAVERKPKARLRNQRS